MNDQRAKPQADIESVLRVRSYPQRRRLRYTILLVAVLAAAGGLGWYLWSGSARQASVVYKTEPVRRGDLTVTVTATGDLQPVNQVDVGTEVSGTIETVEVDNNDRVSAGQVLARLDTDRLEAQLRQSSAALEAARARLLEAQASVLETRNEARRIRELRKKNMVSDTDVDAAEAQLKRAQAAEANAKALIEEASAELSLNQTNLAKAVIRSPIDGLVLERKVEPGQTVAASLQTPVLFSLAENLTQMELHLAVDEADVGSIAEGQEAMFTVDAYPERSFPARITKVRYAPETIEGVVSYETLLSVDNADMALRPGMTATAQIMVESLEDVLLLPNSALRFTPPATSEQAGSRGLVGTLLPHPPRRFTGKQREEPQSGRQKRVWILRDDMPEQVVVAVGATDGRWTELREGELKEGTPVIVDTVNKPR
jgi:HlyD family secretion protein